MASVEDPLLSGVIFAQPGNDARSSPQALLTDHAPVKQQTEAGCDPQVLAYSTVSGQLQNAGAQHLLKGKIKNSEKARSRSLLQRVTPGRQCFASEVKDAH